MFKNIDCKLPNLFIPGAGKSGTSTLHNILDSHPEISMSKVKEPHFWTHEKFDTLSNQDINDYFNLFNNNNNRYIGESSTGYMCFPNFIKNIKTHYSKPPKFIFVLRNPIDRIYSHYWWLKGMGSEKKSLQKAILYDFEIEPLQKLMLPEQCYKMYYQFGLYAKWISKFQDAFGKENILIITTENLKQNKTKTAEQCFSFLGLEPLNKIDTKNTNETKILKFAFLYKYSKKLAFGNYKFKKIIKPFFPYSIRKKINENIHPLVYKLTVSDKTYPKISKNDREWIKNLYKEDVDLLKSITNYPFNEWTDFY